MNKKNIVGHSNIEAGGNVHIGDITYNITLADGTKNESARQSIKSKIQNLIAKNKIPIALDAILEIADNEPEVSKKVAIALKQQWKDLKHEKMIGTLSRQDVIVERNQIVAKALNLIDGL